MRHFNTMNDIANLCSTSSSPGNQVDGLPGALVQNLAELVDPPRRRATIGENDLKFDTSNESCITTSMLIFVFRLICIVLIPAMQSFV